MRVEIHGHRGARGYLPENTIPSFIRAIELGATAIELDVVISKDKNVVVSHEPYMSSKICNCPDGKQIRNPKKLHNIYQMNYTEISKYDCGSRKQKNFPYQTNMAVNKPLLEDVFAQIESYLTKNNLKPIVYNIEIKSDERVDNIFQPEPSEYVAIFLQSIESFQINLSRILVQSFDLRILQELHKINDEVQISFLIANAKTIDSNIDELGFQPNYYTPYYKLLNQKKVSYLHSRNIKVGTWTVNSSKEIARMINIGVDAIISDYPDKVLFELTKN